MGWDSEDIDRAAAAGKARIVRTPELTVSELAQKVAWAFDQISRLNQQVSTLEDDMTRTKRVLKMNGFHVHNYGTGPL